MNISHYGITANISQAYAMLLRVHQIKYEIQLSFLLASVQRSHEVTQKSRSATGKNYC